MQTTVMKHRKAAICTEGHGTVWPSRCPLNGSQCKRVRHHRGSGYANEFSIDSSVTIFEVSVPYRFTVVNKGMMPHELMPIPQLDASITGVEASSGMQPGAMMDRGSGMGQE